MPIEPVKIPQNVYVEDRIIGPVTLKQIMIIMISVGISYAIWAAMKSAGPIGGAQTGIAWIPAIIGAVFAFVKINGISLFRIVLLLIERLDKPSKRVWMPREGIYINIVTKAPQKKKDNLQEREKEASPAIEELSRVLDEGPPRPVDPTRIHTNARNTPMSDITPAPSHA